MSNIWIQEDLAVFEFQYKSLNFPPSCPDYPRCNYEREPVYLDSVFWFFDSLFFLGMDQLDRIKHGNNNHFIKKQHDIELIEMR